MLELNPYRKNKINLTDYDYEKDIDNRMILSKLTAHDFIVLEELLFSPSHRPLEDFFDGLDLSKKEVIRTLDLLKNSGLFTIENSELIIHKEMRKYFEAAIMKFEIGFVPGVEFLQTLLKKVPIHILPHWYPIPRSTDNIFDAIIEKYLKTPQIYQRYLIELNFGDNILDGIMQDLMEAPEFTLPAVSIKQKYGIADRDFEEIMLLLEFNFVACLVYTKEGTQWIPHVTLFYEWREYLRFVNTRVPKPLQKIVNRYRPADFAFVDDLTALLESIDKEPLALSIDQNERWVPVRGELKRLFQVIDDLEAEGEQRGEHYLSHLIHKTLSVKLGSIAHNSLQLSPKAEEWLALPLEQRALFLYKYSINTIPTDDVSASVATERSIKEIEKALGKIFDIGWIDFEAFLQSLVIPLSDQSRVTLQKVGRSWRYMLPIYNDAEKGLLQKVILEFLFEAGITAIGQADGHPCFKVTEFGKKWLVV